MPRDKKTIEEYARRYDKWYNKTAYKKTEVRIKEWLRTHCYLNKGKFVETGCWKSPRSRQHFEHEENNDNTVREITRFSLEAQSEKARAESLFVLKGVGYPVASTILHFAFPKKYPILDFRALWSLGGKWREMSKEQNYNFDFWTEYCGEIQTISRETGEDIRTIDKALWQYSKERQK